MRSVVVFESMYGNTHAVAERVASGLRPYGPVQVGSTDQVSMEDVASADLLVIGGPTHVHGMTSTMSRKSAAHTAAGEDSVDLDVEAGGPGLRTWIKQLPEGSGRMGAAFDTRIDKSTLLTGSAAKGIATRLRKHGFEVIAGPKSFFVEDTVGPLINGEIERAHTWGEVLAARSHMLLSH